MPAHGERGRGHRVHRSELALRTELAHARSQHCHAVGGSDPGKLPLEPIGHRHVVGIESRDVAAARVIEPEVQRGGEALTFVVAKDDEARVLVAGEELRRAILRAVVDDDELELGERLPEDAADGRVEEALRVVRRENDRDERGFRSLHGAG